MSIYDIRILSESFSPFWHLSMMLAGAENDYLKEFYYQFHSFKIVTMVLHINLYENSVQKKFRGDIMYAAWQVRQTSNLYIFYLHYSYPDSSRILDLYFTVS